MRKPLRRGTKVDASRIRAWEGEFSGYRHQVTTRSIERWLEQFKSEDRDLAARVLDAVDFVGQQQITALFRESLASLEGWNRDSMRRRGQWRFIAFSASAGESGDAMIHRFRQANNLAGNRFNALFVHRSDILRERLGEQDSVVLVDDFLGTGDQAGQAWDSTYGELLASVGRTYLNVIAATTEGIERIHRETGMEVVAGIELAEADCVFSSGCRFFNSDEKNTIELYGKRAKSREPRGYRDCGLLLVLAHTCPNNSIPILHATTRRWSGLFRRYD